jgi:putative N-acetylmannosamine-6-phosphate epimerase
VRGLICISSSSSTVSIQAVKDTAADEEDMMANLRRPCMASCTSSSSSRSTVSSSTVSSSIVSIQAGDDTAVFREDAITKP